MVCMYTFTYFTCYARKHTYRCLDWVTRLMNITIYSVGRLIRDWRSLEQRGFLNEAKETMMQSEQHIECIREDVTMCKIYSQLLPVWNVGGAG